MAETRHRAGREGAVTAAAHAVRRYDPESGDAPYWDEHTIKLAPHRSVLEAHPAGTRPLRRLDRDPLLLPPGDLRLLRRARQRRTGARLPHPPRRRQERGQGRRHRDRADGQHARHQGPDRRHGRGALEEDPARHALADQQAARARARVPRPDTKRWSTSPSRWPASSAAPVSRTAWRWRWTPASSARPRSPRPTASWATRAMTSSASG